MRDGQACGVLRAHTGAARTDHDKTHDDQDDPEDQPAMDEGHCAVDDEQQPDDGQDQNGQAHGATTSESAGTSTTASG